MIGEVRFEDKGYIPARDRLKEFQKYTCLKFYVVRRNLAFQYFVS